MDALGKLLEKSPEEALRFEKGLEDYYARTGLPRPQFPKGRTAAAKTGLKAKGLLGGMGAWMGLTALAFAGTAVTAAKYWPQIRQFASKISVTSPAPVSTPESMLSPVSPTPSPGKGALKPAPVHPIPVHGPEGDALSVVVQAHQASLVTVRILDPSGREIRVLYAGVVQPGEWSFQWDGLLSGGQAAPPSDYQIEVQSGSSRQLKKVRLKPAL